MVRHVSLSTLLLVVSVIHSPASPSATQSTRGAHQHKLLASKTAHDAERTSIDQPHDPLNLSTATNLPAPNGRKIQLWACGADPPVPPYGSGAIETSVFTHIENLTAVSICRLSLGSNGSLLGGTDPDIAKKAQLYAGEMGLAVYPMIGGNLSSLHAAMDRAKEFISETVETAVELVADGFNLDLEIGTQDVQPRDTQEYLEFLNTWAAALDTVGLELQYDLGGCNDPFKTDYMGLTCKQLAASKLHRIISMDTYAAPVACGANPCNLTKALRLDKAALCSEGSRAGRAAADHCRRYMPGLMMGEPGALANMSATELKETMDYLLDQGVTSLSLWAGIPTADWWEAMGYFLLREERLPKDVSSLLS